MESNIDEGIVNFKKAYASLVDHLITGRPLDQRVGISKHDSSRVVENGVGLFTSFRTWLDRFRMSFFTLPKEARLACFLYLVGYGSPDGTTELGLDTEALGIDGLGSVDVDEQMLIRALMCRMCLDQDLLLHVYEDKIPTKEPNPGFFKTFKVEWSHIQFCIKKVDNDDNERTNHRKLNGFPFCESKVRRHTMYFCLCVILEVVGLAHALPSGLRTGYQFAGDICGGSVSVSRTRKSVRPEARKTTFPHTEEVARRLVVACKFGMMERRLRSYRSKHHLSLTTDDAILWTKDPHRNKVLSRVRGSITDSSAIVRKLITDGRKKPPSLHTVAKPEDRVTIDSIPREMQSFFIKGEAASAFLNPVDVSERQAPLDFYINETVNEEFYTQLCRIFKDGISGVLSPNNFSGKTKVQEPVILPIHSVKPVVDQVALSTRAWCCTDIFSDDFHAEVMEYLNTAAFLGSSGEVGARGSKTNRYYRCAQASGGFFEMKSDNRLISCTTLHRVEERLIQFVSELAQAQDDIVHRNLPDGMFQYRWNPKRVMCQVTASTLSGSRYMDHNDCGFHHNHEIESMCDTASSAERNVFMNLPHRRLMRVWTFVFSNRVGINGALGFSKDEGGSATTPNPNRLATNHCCLHIQSFGIQSDYKHRVYGHGCQTPKPSDGGNYPGRWVVSIRESIPGDNVDLIRDALLVAGHEDDSRIFSARNDYKYTGVVDSITKKTQPTLLFTGSKDTSPRKPNILDSGNTGGSTVDALNDFFKRRAVEWSDLYLDNTAIKTDRTNPPMDARLGWVEDPKPLSDRILSSYFIKRLFSMNIGLYMKIRENDDEPSYAMYSFIPVLDVVDNWEIVSKKKGSVLSDLVYNHKECKPGDIVRAEHVRSIFCLPENHVTGELWNSRDSRCTNCVILRHHYKNDAKLEEIQKKLDGGGRPTDSFWIGGSGGSAQQVGSMPMSLARSALNSRPPPVAVTHDDMKFDNKLNRCMLECVRRHQVVFVFAPPIMTGEPTSKKSAEDEEGSIDTADFLQYIGVYEVNRFTYDADSIDVVKSAVDAVCAKNNRVSWDQEFWLHSFRRSMHFKFYLRPLEECFDSEEQESGRKYIVLDTDSVLSREKLYYAVDPSSPAMYDNVVEGEQNELQGRLWKMFEERWLPQLLGDAEDDNDKDKDDRETNDGGGNGDGNRGMGDDTNEYCRVEEGQDEEEGPYIFVDDNLFVGDSGGTEEDNAVNSCVGQDYTEPCVVHPIMGGGLHFTFEEMFSMLARVSAAGAARSLGHSFNKETRSYTFLNREGSNTLQNALGEVIQGVPFPMPIRTYDVATSFFIELVQHSCRDFVNPDSSENLCYIRRLDMHDVTVEMLGNLILTSFVVRCTGKVKHLRKYLLTNKRSGSEGWKRLFDSVDATEFPLFLKGCEMNQRRAKKTNSKRKMVGPSNYMTKIISEQFRHSVPNSVKSSVHSFDAFMGKLDNGIRSSVVSKFLKKGGLPRDDAVSSLKALLRGASSLKECNRSLEFVSSQVVCDMEEIFSGTHISNGASNSPFCGDYVVLGYGGMEGYAVLGKILGINGNPPNGVGVTKKRWNKYIHQIKRITEKTRDLMESFTQEQCLSLGLDRISENGTAGNGGEEHVSFCVLANQRYLSDADIEHFMCKLYLLLHRYRGTRYYSLPNPLRSFCHPIPHDSDILANNIGYANIMRRISDSFEAVVNMGMLCEFKDPFTINVFS